MKGHRHNTPFREGDRVTELSYGDKPPKLRGTFQGYCRGYLSHAIVLWDGAPAPMRVAAARLVLLNRPTPEV